MEKTIFFFFFLTPPYIFYGGGSYMKAYQRIFFVESNRVSKYIKKYLQRPLNVD